MYNSPEEYFSAHTLDANYIQNEFAVSYDNNKITIPIYDISGNLIFCRYRQLKGEPKFLNDKGAHPSLFAVHKAKNFDQIVFCEGEPDCMRLWQEGIPAVTGTSGVKTFSEKLAVPLKDKTVYLCLDTDEAGQESIQKYIDVLLEIGATVKVIELPSDYKDVSEYFTAQHTKSDFEKLMIDALSADDWEEKNTPEEYRIISGAEILAEVFEDDEWLVDRILPAEGFSFIVGAEGTAKSFNSLLLAKAVSTGTQWLKNAKDNEGNPLFTAKETRKVLIIDKENTLKRTQSRMSGLKMDGNSIYWFRYASYFELYDPNEKDGLSKIAKSASRKAKKEGIKLVIIDSFTDVMVGNENAANDVQLFFNAMRKLFPNQCILVLHHANKPAAGLMRNSSQKTRGSTNIMAQASTAFYIEPLGKSKTEFVIEQTKARDCEKIDKFIVELVVEDIPNTDRKQVVDIEYKGVLPDSDEQILKAINIITDACKIKLRYGRKELEQLCVSGGVSSATFSRALKKLAGTKIDLIKNPDKGNEKDIIWIGDDPAETITDE